MGTRIAIKMFLKEISFIGFKSRFYEWNKSRKRRETQEIWELFFLQDFGKCGLEILVAFHE